MGTFFVTVALGIAAIVGGMISRNISAESHVATSTATVAASKPFSDSSYKTAKVVIGQETFQALVSDTETLREEGLSDRTGLKNGQAMLFIFDKPDFLGFWMKDMLFSIDMLWLDADHKVVSFQKDASPESYPKVFFPSALAKYVVELPAGTLARLGVTAGDRVSVSGGK